jgi:hypothetical protein
MCKSDAMKVMDPGIIGGFVLPVLGALPDATIIIFSCIGGNASDIQTQVAVGVGTLAGSTIMYIQPLPFYCLTENQAIDHSLGWWVDSWKM